MSTPPTPPGGVPPLPSSAAIPTAPSTTEVPGPGEVLDGRYVLQDAIGEGGVVVFSQWRGRTCVGTFRMPVGDAPALVEILRGSLEEAYGGARSSLLRDFGEVDDQDVG